MSDYLSVIQGFEDYSQLVIDHGLQGRWNSVVSDLRSLRLWFVELEDALHDELPNRELLTRIGSLLADLDLIVTDTLSGPHGDMDTVRESLLDDVSLLLTDIAAILDRILVVMGDRSGVRSSRRIRSSSSDWEFRTAVSNARDVIQRLRGNLWEYEWNRFRSTLKDVEEYVARLDTEFVPTLPRRADAERKMDEAYDIMARLAEFVDLAPKGMSLPYEIAEFPGSGLTMERIKEADALIGDLEGCVAVLIPYSVSS